MEAEKLNSIDDALRVLNEAASQNKDEIQAMIRRDYESLATAFSQVQPEMKAALRQVRDQSMESMRRVQNRVTDSSKEMAEAVDRSAHENPWTFLGVASAVAIITGFMLGRSSKKSKSGS